MPFCPKCRVEYYDWAKICSDCGVALVKELPPQMPAPKPENLEPLVTVGTYSTDVEAEIDQTYLKSAGIESVVIVYSADSSASVLKVKFSDAKEAFSLLKEAPEIIPDVPPEDTIEEIPDDNYDDTDDEIPDMTPDNTAYGTPDKSPDIASHPHPATGDRCPQCGSTNIHRGFFNLRSLRSRTRKCKSCEFEWEQENT